LYTYFLDWLSNDVITNNGIENQKGSRNTIIELKSKTGKTVTNIDGILNQSVDYYSNLYKSNNVDVNVINQYVDNTDSNSLSEEMQQYVRVS
jgi:hypothetical protein